MPSSRNANKPNALATVKPVIGELQSFNEKDVPQTKLRYGRVARIPDVFINYPNRQSARLSNIRYGLVARIAEVNPKNHP